MESDNTNKEGRWEFEDYAFTITGIIVGFLLVVPEILYAQLGISILGGSLGNIAPSLVEGLDYGYGASTWDINQLRSLSPMLFLLTTTICFFKDMIDARKTGGYTGSIFTHTFESLLEDTIYMAISTIMVYAAVLAGMMYASWLAGPITWILFIFIFPLVKKKNRDKDEAEPTMPWALLFIFIGGIVVEIMTGLWIAFPLSWLIICLVKFANTIREDKYSIDTIFDIIYYAFSVILLTVGIILNFWIASWTAFPVALFICWILSKFERFKKSTTT